MVIFSNLHVSFAVATQVAVESLQFYIKIRRIAMSQLLSKFFRAKYGNL